MASNRRPPKRDLTNLTGLRVGLYVRVSLDAGPDKQDDVEEYLAKSTEDQKTVGLAWAEKVGAAVVDIYSDPGISASRFVDKIRPEFARMLADIEAGKLDAIWFWEQSRLSRRQTEYFQLVDLCRRNGVVWVDRDRIIDPNDYKDTLAPGIMASIDAIASEQTSERVKRGKRSAAYAGQPAGETPYGYKRRYDHTSSKKKIEAQELNYLDGDGRPAEDSPAHVVREIFRRVAAGDSLTGIAHDLNTRGIPMPRGAAPTVKHGWRSKTIRRIALNPAYIARRVYHADWDQPDRIREAIIELPEGVKVIWPPAVDEDTFWTVHKILTDPVRKRTRPYAAKSLLSCLISCAKCGGQVGARPPNRAGGPRNYSCIHRGCTSVNLAALDDYVEEIMVRWLSNPAVFAELARVDDSAAAAQARSDAAKLRLELEHLYRDAEVGEVSPTIATRRERALQSQIADAEQRAHEATMPTVLVGRIGPEAEAAWNLAGNDVKRQIIQAVADIWVKQSGLRGAQAWRHPRPIQERVEWRWLIGPATP